MWSCASSLPGSLPASAPQCFCSPRGSSALRRFYSITGRKGNSFKCLGFPVQEKAKQKKSALNSNIQVSPPSLLPTPKDHTLAPPGVHIFCQRRGGYRSHHRAGYLSKKKVLKETLRVQWHSPSCTTEQGCAVQGKLCSGGSFPRKKKLEESNCC